MLVEEWKRKNPPIQRKPITNGNRIRAMTDEELTRLLNDIQVAAFLYGKCRTETLKYPSTPNEWYSWLKQEAVERAEKGEKRHDVGIVPYEEDGRAAEHGDSYGENRNDQDADIGEHIKCAEDFCEIRWPDEG